MRRFPACVAALLALCGPAAARDLTVEVIGLDGKTLATRTVPAACNTRVVLELVTPPRPGPAPTPTPPPTPTPTPPPAPPATTDLSVQVLDAGGKVINTVPVPAGGSVAVGGRGVTPTPTPGPQPGPQPGPVTPTAFTVVVVEETGQAAGARGAMLQDAALARRFKEKGHRWRVVDKDVVGPDGRPPADVKPFLDAAAGKALPQLFLVAPDGSVRYKADAPKTPAEMLTIIEKYGG